ncbi:MAG: DUF58 domain-containing protein [Gammaproteobacteria bacterium]|nr:DUF58 domain-containing protein [Gammaproteobacteria bacterium]MDH3465947.1 DUF58 domain-containing protein [Gammaproteobacteria bacterium]
MADGTHAKIDALIALRLQAARLDLNAHREPRAPLAGGYRSRFRGRGMDFDESRQYLPGDDIRTIDWRVTARTGVPHTKVFREERERAVFIIVDFSPSMFFGTKVAFKSVIAAQAAAQIGWSAIARGDRIGALIAAGEGHSEIRPAGGRRGVLRVLQALVQKSKPPRRSLAPIIMDDTLMRARRVAKPGSLVVIISDFYTLGDDAERHLARLCLHNDVIACWVRDPLECHAPPRGRYAISDGTQVANIDTGGRASRQYESTLEEFARSVRAVMGGRGIRLIELSTADDVGAALRSGLVGSRV